jgi:hypothetical protein
MSRVANIGTASVRGMNAGSSRRTPPWGRGTTRRFGAFFRDRDPHLSSPPYGRFADVQASPLDDKSPQPIAPFRGWPVQSGGQTVFGFSWYTRPAAFVSQTTTSRVSLASSMLLDNRLDRVADRYRAEIAAAGGLFVFHDWRTIRTFDSEIIRYYIDRVGARRVPLRGIVVASTLDGLLRVAANVIGAAVSKVYGFDLELTSDPEAALRRHRLQVPDQHILIA